MPTQWFEQPSIPLTYEQLTDWAIKEAQQEGTDIVQYLNYVNGAYPDADLTDFMLDETGKYLKYVENGDGTYTVLGYENGYQSTVSSNPINSNSTQISRGNFSQVVNHGVEDVGGTIKRHMTPFPSSGSFADKASYVLGSVGSAIGAVSAGITLGKAVDSALYNANPDYWNSIGLSTLNPETWNTITNGDDSPFAGLFNMILGLDPATGNGQMYMDENALAYLAYALARNGWFDAGAQTATDSSYPNGYVYDLWVQPIRFISGSGLQLSVETRRFITTYNYTSTAKYSSFVAQTVNPKDGAMAIMFSDEPFTAQCIVESYEKSTGTKTASTNNLTVSSYTYNGLTVYSSSEAHRGGGYTYTLNNDCSVLRTSNYNVYQVGYDLYRFVSNGDVSGGVDGVSNQSGATLPDISNWSDIPSTLQSLQNQYPDLWDDSLVWDNLQPDGTVVQTRYIPVAMPNATYNNDLQPVSSTATQAQPQLNKDTSAETLLQFITDLITATKTQTQPELEIPPSNPVDTGYGNSPTPIPPTGSASALWAVYHPTQAQVNAFGAWLWSSSFVDQLLKVFQNPMDAIISLHKVFIMPIDAGNTTIHAGYLDSGVSSAYVAQQYVYADCGSVDCMEYFGNVFDYVGTNASLYLPFIGIVPLNINEVMRSTISVKYGCDLFTGAILVEVTISRDGNNVIMYQYGGDGGVQYPVSGSRSGGFLTGLAATIGAAASVATGGAALPAFAAALGGSVMSAQKQVQHSGGFSGNSGAMGCKIPYLIIERPQTKVASLMSSLDGYPTNYSVKLSDCSGQVVVSSVHIEGINATENELKEIERLLKAGILV